MANVFIPNEPDSRRVPPGARAYNVKPAEKYGKIRYVFSAKEKAPSRRDSKQAIDHAYAMMKDATAEDYIATVGGDPFGILVTAVVLADINKGKLKYLYWDRFTNDYKPIDVDFNWDM